MWKITNRIGARKKNPHNGRSMLSTGSLIGTAKNNWRGVTVAGAGRRKSAKIKKLIQMVETREAESLTASPNATTSNGFGWPGIDGSDLSAMAKFRLTQWL